MSNENQEISPVLASIRNDIRMVGEVMQQFAQHVVNDEVSQYPIYVAYLEEVSLGRPFLSREQHHLGWNYNASILEEFVKKGVIDREKVPAFRETYGDPEERACIFVVLPQEGGFVFVPYELDLEADSDLFFDATLN
jgi:hypothetical protein